MLSRFSSLRSLAADVSKLITAARQTALTKSNLQLHTSSPTTIFDYPEGLVRREDLVPYVPPTTRYLRRPKVAMILCGAGERDGTNVPEVISLAVHLDRWQIQTDFYAPYIPQQTIQDYTYTRHRFNKFDRYPQSEARFERFIPEEAARMTFGQEIKNLETLRHEFYTGLIIPGGRGVVDTLSNIYAYGSNGSVFEALDRMIRDCRRTRKPICTTSTGAILVANVLKNVKITMGKEKSYWKHQVVFIQDVLGARYEHQDNLGVTYCDLHNVFSAPGFGSRGARFHEIHYSMGRLITSMIPSMMAVCERQPPRVALAAVAMEQPPNPPY